jgi:murein L,D-transpeptidase YcbB/YkuD
MTGAVSQILEGAEATAPDFHSVAGIQTTLTTLGFDPGPIDGKSGPRTEAAIRRFQLAHGLVADGSVGRLTRAALVEVWNVHSR